MQQDNVIRIELSKKNKNHTEGGPGGNKKGLQKQAKKLFFPLKFLGVIGGNSLKSAKKARKKAKN